MRKRIFATLAALLLALGMSLTSAQPAQADEEDCSEANLYGTICLWKWVNYEGGRWQAKLDTIASIAATSSKPEGCWNLVDSSFGSPHLGWDVDNQSASLVIEPSIISGMTVRLYDWWNCNPTSWLYVRSAHNTYTSLPNLASDTSPFAGYHKITSVRVTID